MKFQINSDDCTLTVSYLDTDWNIGDEKVHRDLIYNAVAAMALIDNLSGVTFEFPEDTFQFSRAEIQQVFSDDLSKLLGKNSWKALVQAKLSDSDFISQFHMF
jgi:hypothetical protein